MARPIPLPSRLCCHALKFAGPGPEEEEEEEEVFITKRLYSGNWLRFS